MKIQNLTLIVIVVGSIAVSCIKNTGGNLTKGRGMWLVESQSIDSTFADGSVVTTEMEFDYTFWSFYVDGIGVKTCEKHYEIDSVGTSDMTTYWTANDRFEDGVGTGNYWDIDKKSSGKFHLSKSYKTMSTILR